MKQSSINKENIVYTKTPSVLSTHSIFLQVSLNNLLVIAIINRQLGLPQHSSPKVRQVHSLDLVNGPIEHRGIDVALVAVGAARQRANVQLYAAPDAPGPVLDGGGEPALGNVAVAVVVELDLHPVEEPADVKGLGLVGVRALGGGGDVVFFRCVLLEVGFELFGHGEVACSVVGFVI